MKVKSQQPQEKQVCQDAVGQGIWVARSSGARALISAFKDNIPLEAMKGLKERKLLGKFINLLDVDRNGIVHHYEFSQERDPQEDGQRIEFLLKNGLKINHKNIYGETPLHSIVRKFKQCIYEIGLRSKYEKSSEYNKHVKAIQDSFKLVVAALIQYGANINANTYSDYTPLQYLHREDCTYFQSHESSYGFYKKEQSMLVREFTEILLKSGAKLDNLNGAGNTVLLQAVDNFRKFINWSLFATKYKRIEKPERQAIAENFLSTIELLVKSGANQGIRSKECKTARDIIEKDYPEEFKQEALKALVVGEN